MLQFPWLVFAIGFIFVLAYFARKNITWDTRKGTKGSIGMALIILIIGLGIGWMIDVYIDWSVIPQYMYATGGSLQAIAIVFFGLYAMLCLSMLYSASKVGTMVS